MRGAGRDVYMNTKKERAEHLICLSLVVLVHERRVCGLVWGMVCRHEVA